MDCTEKATILNKVGTLFQIIVPENGLFVRNIIFDSIDSVLDCKKYSLNFNLDTLTNDTLKCVNSTN